MLIEKSTLYFDIFILYRYYTFFFSNTRAVEDAGSVRIIDPEHPPVDQC